MNTPVALAVARRSRPGVVWDLRVQSCPFCGGTHTHGGLRGDSPSAGWRASDCVAGAGRSYLLVITATVEGATGKRRAA